MRRFYSQNKKAFHDYKVLSRFDAGISLLGQEVKSVKSGTASLRESFVLIENGEMWLWDCHVPRWRFSSDSSYDPTRKRKILMKRQEIDMLSGKVSQKKLTLIPLSFYNDKGVVKVEIGLCQGLKKYDKRKREKERELKKDLQEEKKRYMI